MAESIKYVFLNDFEILGVGGLRKHNLLPENNPHAMVLKTHPHRFLPGLFEQTVEWLKPQQVVPESTFDKASILEEVFFRIFPLGTGMVGHSAQKLLGDYLAEMPWEEGLSEDHFRYFSFFFSRRFPKEQAICDVFSWEWIQNSLTYQDFGDEGPKKIKSAETLTAPLIRLNPSLQIQRLEKASSVLNRDRGLYVFVYSPKLKRVVEKQLNPEEAAILDLLSEDRKFSKAQVIDMRLVEKTTSRLQVLSSLELLFDGDIIRE